MATSKQFSEIQTGIGEIKDQNADLKRGQGRIYGILEKHDKRIQRVETFALRIRTIWETVRTSSQVVFKVSAWATGIIGTIGGVIYALVEYLGQ